MSDIAGVPETWKAALRRVPSMNGHVVADAAPLRRKRACAKRSATMPGMSALRFPHLLLACPRVERVVAKLALEHGQLLIRGVAEPPQRGFLGAGVGRFGVNLAKGAPSLLRVRLVRSYLVAMVSHVATLRLARFRA